MAELRNILVVDDERDIRAVVKLTLEALGGFTVWDCGSGQDAVALAPQVAPDLILLDVTMAGMDGLATLRALRALPETSATPIVFMTARAQRDQIAQLQQAGALDVITKPMEPASLVARVRDIWERHVG